MENNMGGASRSFWNWVKNDEGQRELRIEGVIAEESWFGDEITPRQFKQELGQNAEPITVWINSEGGDVFAASQIYNMLMEYKGEVTIKIDSLAASAASVIAMAGTKTLMSPTAMLMIHNPSTLAFGDSAEFQKAKAMLDEVKESIINAYELKTSLSRKELSKMMDSETWLSAYKAKELGFIDDILYVDEQEPKGIMFARQDIIHTDMAVAKVIKSKLVNKNAVKIHDLEVRLNLIGGK